MVCVHDMCYLCFGPGYEPEVNPFGESFVAMEYLGLLQLGLLSQPRLLNPALVASVAAGAPLGVLRVGLRFRRYCHFLSYVAIVLRQMLVIGGWTV